MRGHLWLYAMILPVIAYFCVFVYYPLYQGVVSSFQEFKLLGGAQWAGTQNYTDVLHDDKFWQVVRNTLLIGGGILVLGFFPPIFLALGLNEIRQIIFKKTAQTAVYLPHLFSWV
ncbi:MAG: hypothetical protein WBA46_04820, partial [Thermomicrobiales bacterium]